MSPEVGPEPGDAESQGPVLILTDGPTERLPRHRAPGCQGLECGGMGGAAWPRASKAGGAHHSVDVPDPQGRTLH